MKTTNNSNSQQGYTRLSQKQAKHERNDVSDNDFDKIPEDEKALKVAACEGKSHKSPCSWTYKGTTYHGNCAYRQLVLTPELYCSDVFFKDNGEDAK